MAHFNGVMVVYMKESGKEIWQKEKGLLFIAQAKNTVDHLEKIKHMEKVNFYILMDQDM